MKTLTFEVSGKPVQQGSMSAMAAGVVVHSKGRELDNWRLTVGMSMRNLYKGPPHAGAVYLDATFCYPPRKSKKHDDGQLKATVPDLDKLLRAIFDAGTGVLWRDDQQIAGVHARKKYDAGFQGVKLSAMLLEEGDVT